MNFIVGENTVATDFPGVEHFAAQGQNGLEVFIATLFSRTTGGVTFDEEKFVDGDILAFAVGELAG